VSNPFSSAWPLGQEVIDYVAAANGVPRRDACLVLQKRFLAEEIMARGPRLSKEPRGLFAGVRAEAIEGEFWRTSPIAPDGRAGTMPWFEVRAEDVLRIWPPTPAAAVFARAKTTPEKTPAKPQGKRGPRESVTPRVIEQMRQMDPKELAEMKHEEMASVFRASASTCKTARDKVIGDSR
jgi:hypothetical protein